MARHEESEIVLTLYACNEPCSTYAPDSQRMRDGVGHDREMFNVAYSGFFWELWRESAQSNTFDCNARAVREASSHWGPGQCLFVFLGKTLGTLKGDLC